MNIRKLEINDYHKGFLELLSNLTTTPPLTENEFQKIYLNYPGEVYVAIENDKIVSSISIVIEKNIFFDIGHIENVVTLPNYRGKGLAKQLLITIMENHKGLKLDLYCAEGLVEFYSKLGFQKCGLVNNKYQ